MSYTHIDQNQNYEFDIIKYNYHGGQRNSKILVTQIICDNEIMDIEISYLTAGKRKKIIKKIMGSVLGTPATTFMGVHKCIPYLCTSLITPDRTYDFEFQNKDELWTFINTIKHKYNSRLTFRNLTDLENLCSNHRKFLSEDYSSYFKRIRYFKDIKQIQEQHECPICFENKIDNFMLKCKHIFCTTCTKNVIKENPKCPLCRHPIITIIT